MSTVTTTRRIDLAQLAAELGGKPLTMVDNGTDRIVVCHTAGHTDAALQAAVDAHVAPDLAVLATNETTIRDRAGQALAANQAFRESAIPSTVAARLTRLEQEAERANRQRSGLIRLVLNRFDGTD